MRLYTDTTVYNETIEMAKNLKGDFDEPVIYHCFWNGPLNDKHYISVLSCFYFNVLNKPNRKIILWTDSPFEDNEIFRAISQFCEVKYFDFSEELKDTDLPHQLAHGSMQYSFTSDRIRYVLLYKYGGIWFDLDIFFLRSLDPLFNTFENEICVYNWSNSAYPNGAIFINLIKENPKMKHFIEFLVERNRGYGFQESNLTYDTPVDLLVLPCSWFDGIFLPDFPEFDSQISFSNKQFFETTDKQVTLDNFVQGAFCYHWHNLWTYPTQQMSYFHQLSTDLINKIKNKLSNNDSNS
jgi:hypothetical protein